MTEKEPRCHFCHRDADAVKLWPLGDSYTCAECMAPVGGVMNRSPEDFLDWLTDPGDPELAAEAERKTERRHKAVAVEGRADGVRLTLNGYCDVNRLEVSPELFRRQDREEVLAARLNEAIARARPSAFYRGCAIDILIIPKDESDLYEWTEELERDPWIDFPNSAEVPELKAGLWHYWRQQAMSARELAGAAELDLNLFADVFLGDYPNDELMGFEVVRATTELTASLGRALGVAPEEICPRGLRTCLQLDVVNLAVLLGELDEERFNSYLRRPRYQLLTSETLLGLRRSCGGEGPLETVHNALRDGVLAIDAPAARPYPRRAKKSRWDVLYLSYESPLAVAYVEAAMDHLRLPLGELRERAEEAWEDRLLDEDRVPDLEALGRNEVDRRATYAVHWAFEALLEDAPDVLESAKRKIFAEYVDAWAEHFLACVPDLEPTSARGRSWAEVERITAEKMNKLLRLDTPLYG